MKMQKLFFLLSVALLFTGCGGKEDIRTGETGLETEIVEEETGTEEAVRETETAGTEEAGETGLPEKETGTETGTIPETAAFSVTEETEGEKKAQAGAERDIKKQEPAGREPKTPE